MHTWIHIFRLSCVPNPVIHPAVSSGDLGKVARLVSQRTLTDQDKYFLLTSHFSPDATYKFPLVSHGRQNRSFQHCWLSRYNGLVYSELDKGGYCKYCVLFGQAPSSVSNLTGVLITLPLTNLQKASEKLLEHFTGVGTHAAWKHHLAAVDKAMHFQSVAEKKQLPVDQQLSKMRAERIAENKQKLKSIAETVIFCGWQGIALRGHHDDWKHVAESSEVNPGNFISSLYLRVPSGDQVLANLHFTWV